MCKKCWEAGRMSSLMVLDNENDLLVLQMVDNQPVGGAIIGPLNEETVSRLEEYALRIRQALTLQQAEPTGKAH